MKKYLLHFLTIFILATTATAKLQACCDDCYDNEGFYVSGLGGAHFMSYDTIHALQQSFKTHTSPGVVVGGALGYKFQPIYGMSYRLEGEIAYRYNNVKYVTSNGQALGFSGHVQHITYMANGLIDFNLNCLVTPYVGFGMGYGKMTGSFKVNSLQGKTKSDGFVYQWIAGASLPVCHKVDLGLEYRYLVAAKHANEHSVCFNLRRYF